MQPIPVLKAGVLHYAGDDGPLMGQTYRMSYDLDQKSLTLALRTPDEQGTWARNWREKTIQMTLPDLVVKRARAGKPLPPGFRETLPPVAPPHPTLTSLPQLPAANPSSF